MFGVKDHPCLFTSCRTYSANSVLYLVASGVL
nr:MAG TPA: hypothetical protein [Caudoviricetes sp.]